MKKKFRIEKRKYVRRDRVMSTSEWKQRIYDSYVSIGFGSTYGSKKYEVYRRYFKKNYLKFMPKDKTARILELGCGMGEFCYFCKKEGYINYQGIDVSGEQIDCVKKYVGDDCNVSVNNMFNYLEQINVFDGGYDVVIMNDVIEHLTKPEIFEVLDAVYRVLNKDGVFLIKTFNMANPLVSTAGRYIAFDHEVCFTEFSMRQVLLATGFKDVKIVGMDIYVFNPIISMIAKIISKINNVILFMFSALYGRTSLKIFEKDILAAGYKRD